jgi:hypothetical protein
VELLVVKLTIGRAGMKRLALLKEEVGVGEIIPITSEKMKL